MEHMHIILNFSKKKLAVDNIIGASLSLEASGKFLKI